MCVCVPHSWLFGPERWDTNTNTVDIKVGASLVDWLAACMMCSQGHQCGWYCYISQETRTQLYAYTTHRSSTYTQSPSSQPRAPLCSSSVTLIPLCSSNLPSQLLCECVGGLASGICHTCVDVAHFEGEL
jgi:hypothetical protein